MQKESEIFNFVYKKEEIESYTNAINKLLENLNQYKLKCRQRILDGFTINHMNDNMDKIISQVHCNRNKQKILNGEGLSNNLNIMKELICLFLQESNEQFRWQCEEYNKNYYELTSDFKETRWSRIKEKLWTYAAWRGFIKILQKLGIIKAVKKVLNNNNREE